MNYQDICTKLGLKTLAGANLSGTDLYEAGNTKEIKS